MGWAAYAFKDGAVYDGIRALHSSSFVEPMEKLTGLSAFLESEPDEPGLDVNYVRYAVDTNRHCDHRYANEVRKFLNDCAQAGCGIKFTF